MPLRARMDIGGRKSTFAPDLFVRLTDGTEFYVHFRSSLARHAAQDQQAAIAVFRHAGKRLIYVDPAVASLRAVAEASHVHSAAWWARCPQALSADIAAHLERRPRTTFAELDDLREKGWLERIARNPKEFWMPGRPVVTNPEGVLQSAIYSEVVAGRLDHRMASPWAAGVFTRGDGRGRSLLKLCLDHAVDGWGFASLDERDDRGGFRP